MVVQLIEELYTAILALIVGLVLFKKLTAFYRLLVFQVLLYVPIDMVATFVGFNGFVFNALMPIETALLFLASAIYFNSYRSKLILFILYSIFLLIFFIDVLTLKETRLLANYSAGVQGIFVSVIFITILYSHFMNKKNNINKDIGVVVVSIGVVLYFACAAPYLGTMYYLYELNPELSDRIFRWIIIPLGAIRYLLMSIAFLIAARTQKLSPSF